MRGEMTEKSYSQFQEDAIVAEYFGSHIGTLVEIGAFHPTDMSNSRLLIERGWNAVLVDCSPRSVRDLLLEYGRHPKVKVVQAAVMPMGHGPLVEVEITDDAVSTTDPATRAKWEGYGHYGALHAAALSVPDMVRFLDKTGWQPEFLSIDTEGTSLLIAAALMGLCRPAVVCAEHDDNWRNFLAFAKQQFGYEKLALNGTNIIIARPK